MFEDEKWEKIISTYKQVLLNYNYCIILRSFFNKKKLNRIFYNFKSLKKHRKQKTY